MHETMHGGRPGEGKPYGAQNKYTDVHNPATGAATSTPNAGFGNNIMASTTGTELTTDQIEIEIMPVSTVKYK